MRLTESVNNFASECGCVTLSNPGEQMECTYTYDGNSNLTSIVGTNTPWYNQAFTYDDLNRLINAEGMYGTIGYTYDRVGNRMTRTVNDDTETYAYLPGTNKLNEITGPDDPVMYTYDANGNITGIGDKVLSYNQNNRLIRVEEDSTILGEYTYNGMGQRAVKASSGVTTIYHYDLNGKLIAESQSDGTMSKEYLYMGKIRTAMVDVDSSAMYYYLNDRLGTPLLMTNDTGTVVWEAYYRPFGDATINPNSTVLNNIRLPGQYYDQETGLHYNWHRVYDPRTGRYLTPDPIGLVGGINLFTYVENNPINLFDPYGLWWFDPLYDDPCEGQSDDWNNFIRRRTDYYAFLPVGESALVPGYHYGPENLWYEYKEGRVFRLPLSITVEQGAWDFIAVGAVIIKAHIPMIAISPELGPVGVIPGIIGTAGIATGGYIMWQGIKRIEVKINP